MDFSIESYFQHMKAMPKHLFLCQSNAVDGLIYNSTNKQEAGESPASCFVYSLC